MLSLAWAHENTFATAYRLHIKLTYVHGHQLVQSLAKPSGRMFRQLWGWEPEPDQFIHDLVSAICRDDVSRASVLM